MAVNVRTFIVHALNTEQEDVLKVFFNTLKYELAGKWSRRIERFSY